MSVINSKNNFFLFCLQKASESEYTKSSGLVSICPAVKEVRY